MAWVVVVAQRACEGVPWRSRLQLPVKLEASFRKNDAQKLGVKLGPCTSSSISMATSSTPRNYLPTKFNA